MKLQPSEHLLSGSWIYVSNVMQADDVCRRVEWLVSNDLRKIASSPVWGDWEQLFQDPADGRYWELTYPHGDLQGGGPPQLKWITEKEAKVKYKI